MYIYIYTYTNTRAYQLACACFLLCKKILHTILEWNMITFRLIEFNNLAIARKNTGCIELNSLYKHKRSLMNPIRYEDVGIKKKAFS